MLFRWVWVCALASLATSLPNDPQATPQVQQAPSNKGLTEQEIIVKSQSAKKHEVKLFKGIFQEYNFKLQKYYDLIIMPQADETVMVSADVVWKQRDLYILPTVQQSQQVHVSVSQPNKSYIHSDSFYTMTGFKFKGLQRMSYRLVFTQSGSQEKMILLKISYRIRAPQNAAKKDSMQASEERVVFSQRKLQNAISQIKAGQVLDKKIMSYILHQSTAYSHFQILQGVIVVLISCLQVIFITKLIKRDSII